MSFLTLCTLGWAQQCRSSACVVCAGVGMAKTGGKTCLMGLLGLAGASPRVAISPRGLSLGPLGVSHSVESSGSLAFPRVLAAKRQKLLVPGKAWTRPPQDFVSSVFCQVKSGPGKENRLHLWGGARHIEVGRTQGDPCGRLATARELAGCLKTTLANRGSGSWNVLEP